MMTSELFGQSSRYDVGNLNRNGLYTNVRRGRVGQSDQMITILIFLLFIGWTKLLVGQSVMQGTWNLDSYTVDNKKPDATHRLKNEKLTFEKDGQYVRMYHRKALAEEDRIHLT